MCKSEIVFIENLSNTIARIVSDDHVNIHVYSKPLTVLLQHLAEVLRFFDKFVMVQCF